MPNSRGLLFGSRIVRHYPCFVAVVTNFDGRGFIIYRTVKEGGKVTFIQYMLFDFSPNLRHLKESDNVSRLDPMLSFN